VSTDQELAERLDAFLQGRGLTRAAVLEAIGEPFGNPLLVVATGSILHGFSNKSSDLDINVVVAPKVTRLPIGSYAGEVLLDVAYYSASEVENWIRAIRDHPWPRTGLVPREDWKERLATLYHSARLGYGLSLSAEVTGSELIEELRKPWLCKGLVEWWQIEAWRLRTAGKWLASLKPLLAAQRYFDAALAALEGRAAGAGQPYFGPKWLSEKLRVLDDAAGLKALRTITRLPTTAYEARDYVASCEALVREFAMEHDPSFAAQLSYLPGVKVHALDGRSVVTRWNMRGIEVRRQTPKPLSQLVWQGPLDAELPADIAALFVGDMTWLSIVAGTP
jgi:hypothetical protein